MRSRPLTAVSIALLLCLAGCTVGYQSESAVEQTPDQLDPDRDALGYVDGYWYDDELDIDPSDGLTDTEREAIVSRAMARVQLLRGAEFDRRVPVELVTREEFREQYPRIGERNVSDAANRLDNVEHEALLLVGPERDVSDVRAGNRGDNVLGFYSPSQERIVVVSEREPATFDDELTLAHELLHALQDQQFGLESLGEPTTDETNARNGLIEGEAVLVEQRYERYCETEEWQCVGDDTGSTGGIGPDFHFGVYFLGFFPYAEGPSFVEYHEQRHGWETIDEMHAAPPTRSSEIVYPATYGEARGDVTIEDRNGSFERIEPSDTTEYASVGQAGVTTMFVYTLYDEYNESVIVDSSEFFNVDESGDLDDRRPFTYDISYAEGIEHDRLHAYADDGGTGYVWRLGWNDRANATQFADGYNELLAHWGGDVVAEGDGTVFEIEAGSPFAGAVWIDVDGTEVTIVGAPTVEELGEVYAPAANA